MDNGYADSNPTILRAVTPSHGTPYLDNLFNLMRQPLPSMGSNLPLPGLFEATSRIKCEDMMAGIFSRAAAHLYEKTTKHPELSFSSPSTCDLRGCQSQSSAVPAFDTMYMTASSTGKSFNFLNSSNYTIPSRLVHPVIATSRERGVGQLYERAETDCFSLVSPSSFSEFMLHAMAENIAEVATRRLMPATSLPSTTSPLDQNSLISENMSSSFMYSKLSNVQLDVLGALPHIPDSPNSPSKQDSSAIKSTEDSDVDRKIQSSSSIKRRNCGFKKTQQKKVVCVPFCESKQKGEAPPSDTWAWRKYGQKPIKGSPFPRGYYRCSSTKGCPARKQVERSRNDPTVVIVTYTADHNHLWPASKSCNSSKPSIDPIPSQQKRQETSSYRKAENLFSSIINSSRNAAEEQVVSSMDSLQEEESFFLQRDADLSLSRTSTEGDDVFDNLGELPESSVIFSKGFVEGHFD